MTEPPANAQRPQSHPAPTRRGVHDRLMQLAAVKDNGFRPERTLRLRVELVRQLRRRRTQLTVLVLLALPLIIALAFEVSSNEGSSGAPRGAHLAALARDPRWLPWPPRERPTSRSSPSSPQSGSCSWSSSPCSAATPWPARPAGRPCATCSRSRCPRAAPAAEADRGPEPQLWCEPASACLGLSRRGCVLRLGTRTVTTGRDLHDRSRTATDAHHRLLRQHPVAPGGSARLSAQRAH